VLLAFLLEERLPEHIGLNYMWIVGDVKEEIQAGKLSLKGKRVVIVCTGHGLKDLKDITRSMATPIESQIRIRQ
jgi:hypothetical protein